MAFESIEIVVVVEKKLADMEDWKQSECWSRAAYIMMVLAGHQNGVAQCSVSTVKTVRCDVDGCNGDMKRIARRKGHSRRFDHVHPPNFTQQLINSVLGSIQMTMRICRRFRVISSRRELLLENHFHGRQVLLLAITSGKGFEWLKENFYDFINANFWPPNSTWF